MLEPGWIGFSTAAAEIRKRHDCGWAEAKVQLRTACADAKIDAEHAPLDPDVMPRSMWKRIAPSEWKERQPDYAPDDADGCKVVVMLNEDDFRRWLSAELKPQKPRATRLRKLDMAKEAISCLWPQGIPKGRVNKEIIQKVGDWYKAQGLSAPSSDTILRAAGLKD